ncbi:MAG TPA: alkaline phosphatase family protein, partial [Candidatus Dormibacteraeota bacterium]|nr:alkaline phosphatase family protein [Candidatus Dormibacteraeota bacterium]
MATNDAYTRRTFLKKSAVAGAAVLGGTLWTPLSVAANAQRPDKKKSPIKHLIISCQENRSFDHYFGYAAQVQAKGYGPPPGYTQPDAAGGHHAPFEFTALSTNDPPHGWNGVHKQYDGGRMDGFY